MKSLRISFSASLLLVIPTVFPAVAFAQNPSVAKAAPLAASAPTPVPALLPFSGIALASDGKPLEKAQVSVTFLLFTEQNGGEPVWAETQTVATDATGHYDVQLGAASATGLPLPVFAEGDGRWLEVQVAGQKPEARVLLMSVPYAIKAADAATLGGLPASAYVLASAVPSISAASAKPDVSASAVTTPGGAAGYLPVFSGAATIGNSILFESAKSIGVNTIAPAANLDVNGSAIVRGDFLLESKGVATAALGQGSQPLEFIANAFNKTSAKATASYFALQAEPYANNTATPGATLNLIYGNGTGAAETGLSIASNGILKFAPGQTFPGVSGTISGVTTASPLTGGGTTGSVALGLNLTALQTALQPTLNASYAQLNAVNRFTQPITFAASQTFPGTGTITGITAGTGLKGGGTSGAIKLALDPTVIPTLTGSPVFTSPADGIQGITNANYTGVAGVLGQAGNASGLGVGGISGVWGDAYAHVGVVGTSWQYSGVQGISNSSYGVQGTSNSNTAVLGTSNSGTGVSGLSTSSSGVAGYTSGNALNTAGVNGIAGATSGQLHIVAGVWGDSYQNVGVEGTSNQSDGVYGQSTVYNGVVGVSNAAIGVSGTSTSGTGASGSSTSGSGMVGYTGGSVFNTGGVIGIAGPRTNFGGISGVWGDAANHVGVLGTSNSYAGVQGTSVSAPGVQGTSTSGSGLTGTSSTGDGILGLSFGNIGVYGIGGTSAIFGETNSTSGGDAAVYGLSHNNALGVFGFSPKFGVEGVSGGNSSTGAQSYTFVNGPGAVWGDGGAYAVTGTTDDGVGGQFFNNSSSQAALRAVNSSSFGGSHVADFSGTSGGCSFFGDGDVLCTGTISSSNVARAGDRAVKTYSVQSAESWYEDAGSAQLINGVAHVPLDPAFGETVNAAIEYHVFLTPGGESEGLYVTNKTANGFEVHEQHGGHSNIAFDYRIMAKRAGHEKERLEDVTERMKKQAEMRAGMLRTGNADSPAAGASH